MANRKSTKYTEEEIDKIRDEFLSTSITLKELVIKYNLSVSVRDSFKGIKSKRPKTHIPQDMIDEIVNYYLSNDVTYNDMKKIFGLTDYQCNVFLSHKKNDVIYKVYDKYDDEYWNNVIIPEYMKDGVTGKKIKEKFNVSDKDVNKRFKGLKVNEPKVGDTNNLLTIIDINIPSVLSGTQWRRIIRVRCECGSEFDTKLHDFKIGRVKSCGCLLKNSHGHTFYSKDNTQEGRKTYCSYSSMKARCLNPNHHNFPHYGGRGIKICDRWLEEHNGYKNFLEDMGYRPEGMTLDRIDVDGNYEPGNCRWADGSTQKINQRRFSHIKQYTDEEWLDIQKDYIENKLSYDDISEKYSVSSKTIMNHFGGIRKLEKIKLWETINEFYKNNKVTYRELSEMFGISESECVKHLIKD
jgi:hypothetical protein